MKPDQLKLTNADPAVVAQAVYATIDALQRFPREVRLLARACGLHLDREVNGADPSHLMSTAANLMASPEGRHRREEFRAARDYMENEK